MASILAGFIFAGVWVQCGSFVTSPSCVGQACCFICFDSREKWEWPPRAQSSDSSLMKPLGAQQHDDAYLVFSEFMERGLQKQTGCKQTVCFEFVGSFLDPHKHECAGPPLLPRSSY